jgi:GxxExxY protein
MALLHDADLSDRVIAASITVHKTLGAGLLESIYERALAIELQAIGSNVRTQVELPVHFRGQCLGVGLRLDLLVDERLIVEVKSVARLDRLHLAQVLTYLRVAGLKTALLINFNSYRLIDGIKRIST